MNFIIAGTEPAPSGMTAKVLTNYAIRAPRDRFAVFRLFSFVVMVNSARQFVPYFAVTVDRFFCVHYAQHYIINVSAL
jgi:hypothetical protein